MDAPERFVDQNGIVWTVDKKDERGGVMDRPKNVKVKFGSIAGTSDYFTKGRVYQVKRWRDGDPFVVDDDGDLTPLFDGEWVPVDVDHANDEPATVATNDMTVAITFIDGVPVYRVTDAGGHDIIPGIRADDWPSVLAAIDTAREAVARGWDK